MSSLFGMAPKRSTEVLSNDSTCKKAAMCLAKKTGVSDKLGSGMSFNAVGMSSMLMN